MNDYNDSYSDEESYDDDSYTALYEEELGAPVSSLPEHQRVAVQAALDLLEEAVDQRTVPELEDAQAVLEQLETLEGEAAASWLAALVEGLVY